MPLRGGRGAAQCDSMASTKGTVTDRDIEDAAARAPRVRYSTVVRVGSEDSGDGGRGGRCHMACGSRSRHRVREGVALCC